MIAVRVPRALKIIAIVVIAYLALMLLVLLPALNILAPRIYQQQTGRELRLDKIILLNPFTLTLSVRNAASVNADGSPFWALDLLRMNLSLASLWQRHLVLDELQLGGADIQINQISEDRFNFSEILDFRAAQFPAVEPTPAGAKTESPLQLTVHKLIVTAQHFGLNAPYLSEPLALDLRDFSLVIADLTTDADAENEAPPAPAMLLRSGAISMGLSSIAVEFLRGEAGFATQLRDLELSAAQLSTAATSDQPLSLSIVDASGGRLELDATLALGARRAGGRLGLRNIDLLPAWRYLAPTLAFNAERALLDGDLPFALDWSDTLRYALSDGALALREVQLRSKADAQTAVAFAALQVEGLAVDSTLPLASIAKLTLRDPQLSGWNRDTQVSLVEMFKTGGDDESDSEPSAWRIAIDAIETEGGSLRWEASQLPETALVLAPLNAHVSHVRWPGDEPMQLRFETTLNEKTRIAVQGDLIASTVSGKLDAEIAELPLALANPLLHQQMRATLHSGSLSARAQIALEQGAATRVQSEGRIQQFEMQGQADKHKLLAWTQLSWQALALDLSARRLRVDQIAIDQPWLQFRLNADGTNNIQQLLTTSTPSDSTGAPGQEAAPAAATEKPWRMGVKTIDISKASLDFRDNSLASAFRTNITELSGTITNLSTAPQRAAKVALRGSVDGYAPVALSGTLNPFAEEPAMNIALDITNLDLATLTPYSGTYAGYKIDSGRLSVQLVYTLEDGLIRGTNHIVVNQLQLGEQISGPKVRDLPLRFAIYLLTDANGVMDLGVDVTGSVDDPDFSVGSIIWKAFRNLIVKTAASPFRALANLVGGADRDNLDRVSFAPGSDVIAAGESDKLKQLTAALNQKPALKLSIRGHISPSQDIEALRDVALSQQLIAEGDIAGADIQQQSAAWQEAVKDLFRERFPERKSEPLQTMQMNDAMRDNIELPSSALLDLATRRGLALKQALIVEHGLAADRATAVPVELGSDEKPGLHATMDVE